MCGEAARVRGPMRDVTARHEGARVEHRLQAQHVAEREASGEQARHELHARIEDRAAQEGVDADQTVQINDVLRESDTTVWVTPAEHPRGRARALVLALARAQEVAKHLDE